MEAYLNWYSVKVIWDSPELIKKKQDIWLNDELIRVITKSKDWIDVIISKLEIR